MNAAFKEILCLVTIYLKGSFIFLVMVSTNENEMFSIEYFMTEICFHYLNNVILRKIKRSEAIKTNFFSAICFMVSKMRIPTWLEGDI